jgi:hypothetical protein
LVTGIAREKFSGENKMTIEERLEALEKGLVLAKRRNRFLLIGLVVLGIAWAFTITTGTVKAQSDETNITATSYQLVDADGYTRAWLGMGEEGPSFILYDANGIERAILSVDNTGPMLGLYDDIGFTRALMALDEKGEPAIGMFDDIENPIWSAP